MRESGHLLADGRKQQMFKVRTTTGTLAKETKVGLTAEQAHADADDRNKRAAELDIETRYEVVEE